MGLTIRGEPPKGGLSLDKPGDGALKFEPNGAIFGIRREVVLLGEV